ncbi:MAG: hypothetical protein AAF515_21055 [Pseudomonadota bacterium]
MRTTLTIIAILGLATVLFYFLMPDTVSAPAAPPAATTRAESPVPRPALPAAVDLDDAIETVDLALAEMDDEDDWDDEDDEGEVFLPKPVTNWDEIETIEGTILSGIMKQGDGKPATKDSPIGDDYDFPTMLDDNGALKMSIPDDPIPSRPSRRQLQEGNGAYLLDGDTVNLSYDMFSWSTGELVEASAEIMPQGLDYTLGAGADNAVDVPDYLSHSIRGRRNGTQLQVVLEQGTDGLPGYLDPNDGYVLVVNIEQGDRRKAESPNIDFDKLPQPSPRPMDDDG